MLEDRGFIDNVIDTLSAPPNAARGNARSTSPVPKQVGALGKVDDVVPAGTGIARVETPRTTVHDPSADHIFGDRPGHLPDTPENRDLLETTSSNRDNFLGSDEFGNDWYAETLDDGHQAWASVRNGEVRNGGVNDTQRDFNEATGLSRPTRPGEQELTMEDRLTAEQAFHAMTEFLKQHYRRTNSDDIGALLGDMRLLGEGQTADPAAWADWMRSVDLAFNKVPASTEGNPSGD